MQIAIPTFGTRVSPRFDCARTMLLVSADQNGTPQLQELEATDWAPHTRINKLLELGVDTVICGGIDCWSAASLESANVAIYCGVTGEAQEALDAFMRGELFRVMSDDRIPPSDEAAPSGFGVQGMGRGPQSGQGSFGGQGVQGGFGGRGGGRGGRFGRGRGPGGGRAGGRPRG